MQVRQLNNLLSNDKTILQNFLSFSAMFAMNFKKLQPTVNRNLSAQAEC